MISRVVVSSAAKTFSVTGWKTGWACAPTRLLDGVLAAKQFLTFVAGGPFQPAVAYGLNNELGWVEQLRKNLQHKRDQLATALAEGGFDVRRSDGSYFVCADIGPLGEDDAQVFCRALPERIGVAAVPVSAFVDHPQDWNRLVRFTFCKREETLARGIERLHHLR